MIGKIVTARKEHSCAQCCYPIYKGEPHWLFSGRYPVYARDDCYQVGIEYLTERFHTFHGEDIRPEYYDGWSIEWEDDDWGATA